MHTGLATPSDLIDDPLTTPFNIGTRVELADFEEGEAARLVEGLDRDDAVGASLIRRVLHWTSGHPYLTQRMCQAVQADEGVQTSADVDRVCEELFFSERAREQEPNLQFVRNQMLWREVDHAALLNIYGEVVRGKEVANDETNPLTDILRLAGIVRVEAGVLRVRNPIYAHVFDGAWVRENMPDAELRRLRVASRRAMLRTGAVAAVVIALLGVFAGYAVVQRNEAASQGELATAQTLEAVRTLAVAQADKGRMMLRDDDTNGLLYLAQARETADGMPELARSIAEDWTLWHWQLDGRLMQVFGHDDDVTAMAFSPDGDMFITGSADGTAQLWDTATGDPRGKPLVHGARVGQEPPYHQHSRARSLVCFNSDASLVAVGGDDGTITVWNTETTDLHLPRLRPGVRAVSQIAFGAGGSLVAYASTAEWRSVLWRWDMSDGSVLLDGSAVLDVEYGGRAILSVDGSRLLTTHGLALVDAATAEVEWRTGRPAVLTSAAWSESLFAVGYFNDPDYLAQVYDWRGNTVYSFRESTWVGASAPVQVEITPDGKHLVTVTHEGFRVWDLATGEPVGVPITHDGWVTYRAFSADSRLLAGAFGSTVLVWDIETGDLATEPIQYPQRVKALLFHPTDPDVLAVQSVDRTVRLWDVSSAAQYKTLATYPGGTGAGNFSSAMVAFSPTAPLVAASSQRDPAVVITNVTTGLREGEPLMHGGAPNLDADPWGEGLNAVVFSPDGSQLAVADWGRGLYLWDVDTATLAVPVQEGRAVSVAFAPDGSKLAWLAGRDLSVWDMGPGEPTTIAYWDLGLGSVGDPGGVDFNAFGDRIVLVTHQGQATVFRTEGMVQVGRQMRMDGRSDCARWSPDDTLIVTSSEDSSAQLWDASTQRPAGPPLRHGGRVRWANFSSDGRYVGTASDDMTAQLWDVATGKRVALPMRHTSAVLCIEFSPDGRYVATAAAQDARLWELPRTPDTLAEVQRKTWLATGTRLTDEGAVESLGWQEWQALRVDAAAP